MTPDRLRELIAGGETLDVEFKGERIGPLSDREIVSASASLKSISPSPLLPDPVDQHCTEKFKGKVRPLLERVGIRTKTDEDLRRVLLKFIGTLANWDLSTNPIYARP